MAYGLKACSCHPLTFALGSWYMALIFFFNLAPYSYFRELDNHCTSKTIVVGAVGTLMSLD